MPQFREYFRNCDVLLIDDIHDLKGKKATQEEFLHTFEKLYMEGKQIVLTSRISPKNIKNITDRLVSRFVWGMVVDMQQSNTIIKKKMIEQLCQQNNIQLDNASIMYLIRNVEGSFRRIEGLFIRLQAISILEKRAINLSLTVELIRKSALVEKKCMSIEEVVDMVANEGKIKSLDIYSKKQYKPIVKARQLAIFLANGIGIYSPSTLAYTFGYKNTSSISRIMKRVCYLMKTNEDYKNSVDDFQKRVKDIENG